MGVVWDYENGSMDKEKSRKVVIAYLTRYGKFYEKKFGKKITIEGLARMHNSGPYWFTKTQKTDKYWNKVKEELEKYENNK